MKTYLAYALIIVSFTMMITGCYTEHRAARHIWKAQSRYPATAATFCSGAYPPLAFVKDSLVYLPGETLVLIDTVIKKDSINKTQDRYFTKYITRTDTIRLTKSTQVVNRAAEQALSLQNEKLAVSFAKAQQRNRTLLWVAIVLGTYTLLRWVLRVWNIRLL